MSTQILTEILKRIFYRLRTKVGKSRTIPHFYSEICYPVCSVQAIPLISPSLMPVHCSLRERQNRKEVMNG